MMPIAMNTIYTPSLESSEKLGSACIRSMSLCSISTWIFASTVLNMSETGSQMYTCSRCIPVMVIMSPGDQPSSSSCLSNSSLLTR